MAQLNPMLEELQQQILQHNKDAEAMLDKVADNQNRITIGIVVFNVTVFILLEKLFGSSTPLITGLDNTILNLLATICLLLISFPTAAKYGKRNLKQLKLNEEQIKPKLNYAGSWEYQTNFRIQTLDDGTEEYQRFKENMEGYEEHGISQWTQNVFELKIEYANTALPKTDGVPKKPQVNWQSNPISYDEHEVRWSFNGKIWWADDKNYANEFSGIEFYHVRENDGNGHPSLLEGRLIGTILIGEKFFVVDAISSFKRITESEKVKTENEQKTT